MTLKIYQHKIGSPAFADEIVVTEKKSTRNILLMFGLDKEPEVAVAFGTSTVEQVKNTLHL